MKKYWKLWLVLAVALAGGAMSFLIPSKSPVKQQGKVIRVKAKPKPGKKQGIAAKSERRMRQQVQQRTIREKPVFDFDDDDERKLNDVQRKLLEEIRAAIDADDKKTLIKLVQKMQASEEWPDGIPVAIRKAAIAALGWFGYGCLPEIAGFLADGNEEVMEMAVNQYEEALSDPDLSDRERSKILALATTVITDDDSLDCMLMELNNMRHSVAVETFIEILNSGNDVAKGKLAECIEFYTGEEDITTEAQLKAWLTENPDGEDDEEFYGRWDADE